MKKGLRICVSPFYVINFLIYGAGGCQAHEPVVAYCLAHQVLTLGSFIRSDRASRQTDSAEHRSIQRSWMDAWNWDLHSV